MGRLGCSPQQKEYPIPNHPGSVDPRASITLSEVLTRSCKRAEFPEDYVRVLGQDSGGNVNAGWYLISAKAFGMHFLRYVLELFEIYGPTGVWGQNVIQEALLVVMRGEPPHLWSYSIPCSGEKLGVLPRRVLAEFEGQCAAEGGSGGGEGGEAHGGGAGSSHGDNGPGSAAFRECVVGKAFKHVEATRTTSPRRRPSTTDASASRSSTSRRIARATGTEGGGHQKPGAGKDLRHPKFTRLLQRRLQLVCKSGVQRR